MRFAFWTHVHPSVRFAFCVLGLSETIALCVCAFWAFEDTLLDSIFAGSLRSPKKSHVSHLEKASTLTFSHCLLAKAIQMHMHLNLGIFPHLAATQCPLAIAHQECESHQCQSDVNIAWHFVCDFPLLQLWNSDRHCSGHCAHLHISIY